MKKLIVIASIFVCAVPVIGQPALEGSWTVTSSVDPIDSLAHGTFTGSNRLLVVTISTENSPNFVATAVNLGNRSESITLTEAVQDNVSTAGVTQIWYANDTQIGNHSIDSLYFTWSGTDNVTGMVIGVATFSGIDQTGTILDDTVMVDRTGTTPDPLVTGDLVVKVDDLVIGVHIEGNPQAATWNNSFTEAYDVTAGSDMLGTAGYKIITSGTTQAISVSITSTRKRAVLVGATFDGIVSAGGDPLPTRRRKVLLGLQ